MENVLMLNVCSAQSTQVNKSRLRVLQARDQMIADLFDIARQKLKSVSQDKARYKTFLKDSLVQVRWLCLSLATALDRHFCS